MNRIAQSPLGASRNSGGLSASTGTKPIQDLREWLSCVDRMGELVRVHQPVDRDEETSAA
jgi:hypothetical protein